MIRNLPLLKDRDLNTVSPIGFYEVCSSIKSRFVITHLKILKNMTYATFDSAFGAMAANIRRDWDMVACVLHLTECASRAAPLASVPDLGGTWLLTRCGQKQPQHCGKLATILAFLFQLHQSVSAQSISGQVRSFVGNIFTEKLRFVHQEHG